MWRKAEVSHANKPTVKPSIVGTDQEVSYRARNFIRGIVNNKMGTQQHTRFRLKYKTSQYFHDKDKLKEGQWRDSSVKQAPMPSNSKGSAKRASISIAVRRNQPVITLSNKVTRHSKQKQEAYKPEQRRLKRTRQALQQNLQTKQPDEKNRAQIKLGQRCIPTMSTRTKEEEEQQKKAMATRLRDKPSWKQQLFYLIQEQVDTIREKQCERRQDCQ